MTDFNEDLVESLVRALRRISDSSGSINKLVFKCLEALKLLPLGELEGRVNKEDLTGIDIFTPIIQCVELENRWDVVAIYLAYFSIHRGFHPLVTNSITSWHHLLPTDETLALEDAYRPGFLTVLSWVDTMSSVGPEILKYANLQLRPVLVTSWIPQWLSFLERGSMNLTEVSLFDESILDFYIVTDCVAFVEQHVLNDVEGPLSYHVYNICKRMTRFQGLIPQSSFVEALQLISPIAAEKEDLSFDLQVLMEVVDHPEVNLSEATHLCLLVSLAMKRIRKTPWHTLHTTLGSLGSVQSLPALINMAQYLLGKFLINSNNILWLIDKNSQLNSKSDDAKWYHSKQSDFQLPHWFETSIIPPMPPIAKSSFAFNDSKFDSKNDTISIVMITQLLLESLNGIIITSTDLLKQYRLFGIDPLRIDTKVMAADSSVSHKIMQNYLELYYIPIITALLLSEQLAATQNKILGDTQARIWSRLLQCNSRKLYTEVIQTHGNVGLFYLIRFVTRVSFDDLTLQRICIQMMSHIFFHDTENSTKVLLTENVLTKQALYEYIKMWNDGTDVYQRFFIDVFDCEQPMTQNSSMTIDDMIQLLPERDEIIQQKEIERKRRRTSTEKHSPRRDPMKATPAQPKKYNAYSATPFIPATKPARTLASNVNVQTNYEQPVGAHTWNSSDTNLPVVGDDMSFTDQLSSNFDLSPFNPHSLNGIPKTPNMTTSTLFSSPWDTSPDLQSTPNLSKIVSTGKNYILGGHSRIKNNSRAQSIHIDSFEHPDHSSLGN